MENPDRIKELSIINSDILMMIAKASPTLVWFSKQILDTRGVPMSTSRLLDRPFLDASENVGPAFEIWHAMLRAECALRTVDTARARELEETIAQLQSTLQEKTAAAGDDATAYARPLVCDDIYGTLNPLTAASVLRSEVYPARSDTTPSYLAGHILFAELSLAALHAESHAATGLGARPPRLAVIARGVHSIVLYVEHLRERASIFAALADSFDNITRLHTQILALGPPPPHHVEDLAAAEEGYVRYHMARLRSLSRRAGSLILATRSNFRRWSELLDDELASRPLTVSRLETSLRQAFTDSVGAHAAGEVLAKQAGAAKFAHQYCAGLSKAISDVYRHLAEAFQAENESALFSSLDELREALRCLAYLHTPHADSAHPSIRNAARFRFLWNLTEELLESSENTSRRHDILQQITARFDIPHSADTAGAADAVLRALGTSSAGRSMLRWWRSYAECYACPQVDPFSPNTAGNDTWFQLRHRAFECIHSLRHELGHAVSLSVAASLFKEASRDLGAIANRVEILLKAKTNWCAPRAQQMLLATTGDDVSSLTVDANELVAGLWIADRIGEPWPADLEDLAVRAVAAVQRPDGGFYPVTPFYESGGFVFYPSSASTIASLARFVSRGGIVPNTPEARARLKRWEAVLKRGVAFLKQTMVGGDTGSKVGWHSDRNPSPDRIDSLSTVDAVTALCRTSDVLKWLMNLEAYRGLRVQWPQRVQRPCVPMDCGRGARQLALKADELTEWLRYRTGPYRTTAELRPRSSSLHSLILYGPPGTGKTYFQDTVAADLGWPVLSITVGDLLKEGEAYVGKRAVELLERLNYAAHTCVTFDEFDQLVYRRSHDAGARSRPELLTPTMLPLLSNLRDGLERRCCVVSFTTNYIQLVDSAARRAGRIDDEVLIVYPDFPSRLYHAIDALADGSSVSWDEIIRRATETALNGPGTMRRRLEEGVPTREYYRSETIQRTHYPSEDEIRKFPELLDEVISVVKSIGRGNVLDAFLRRDENSGWLDLWRSLPAVGRVT